MSSKTEFIVSARFEHDMTELQMRTLISLLRFRRFSIAYKIGSNHSKTPAEFDLSAPAARFGPAPIKSIIRFQKDMSMGDPILERWDDEHLYPTDDIAYPLIKKGYLTKYKEESKLPRGVLVLPNRKTLFTEDVFKPKSEGINPYYCLTSAGLVFANILETDFMINGILGRFSGKLDDDPYVAEKVE